MTVETVSEIKCHNGIQGVYTHRSAALSCDMTFGLFLPQLAQSQKVPLIWFLSGLTCTHENAMVKAGAQSWAAQHDVALIFPDTSPRGDGVADDEAFDLGQGAGFYVNATQAPWAPHFKMWDYIAEELPSVMDSSFPIDMSRQSISGHSMGGHGALTLALRQPGRFKSVSAFAPICNPMKSDWGIKQFTAYLGEDKGLWAAHDASQLMAEHGFDGPILIDNGSEDPFLEKLRPEAFADAVAARGHNAQFRLQPGYDHSYFFISTFMQEHIAFHADYLR